MNAKWLGDYVVVLLFFCCTHSDFWDYSWNEMSIILWISSTYDIHFHFGFYREDKLSLCCNIVYRYIQRSCDDESIKTKTEYCHKIKCRKLHCVFCLSFCGFGISILIYLKLKLHPNKWEKKIINIKISKR